MSWRFLLLFAALFVAVPACKTGGKVSLQPAANVGDEARSQFDRGVKLMDQGGDKYDAAVKAFRGSIALEPTLWEAHLNIGIIELRRARLSGAARALESSVDIYGSPEALEALGEVYTRQGRAKKAVALYERALQQNPDDLTLRNRLAAALRNSGQLDDAEAELRAVLGRDAGNLEAYNQLSAIWFARGDLDLAELVLNKGLAHHPNDPALLTNLGLVALQRGDDQHAFAQFEKASAADPQFLTGRLNKAAVYLGAGDHTRATEELEFILKVEPGNTRALMGLGLAKRLGGDLDGARKSWAALLKLDPENVDVHYNLAILEMDFADKAQEAENQLHKFLELAPEDHERINDAKERLELLKAIRQAG
jgi:tetratricopeptide (TPR) repeat protein